MGFFKLIVIGAFASGFLASCGSSEEELVPCASFAADSCPERCAVLDGIDLSADRTAEEPTCDGPQVEFCGEIQDGSAVSVVLYREQLESPSAVLFGATYTLDGWESCPVLEEAYTGDEPAVCRCAL
ncbi:hypothetical protein FRD01_19470 [Microvenator marinus]|uniref:Lipoprotein n=1 Tax=Microvenator marinus TaxID=2600177 RepID=A0A5B8XTW8_9DELT|nr:hypothetical protein [Microvenator marinus]QED29372.1 hypothetical protein FRD01_19470 [Microvenator marinus]